MLTGLFRKKPKSDSQIRENLKELRKLVKDKKYDDALDVGKKILEKNPSNHDVNFIVGGIFYMRKQYHTAISYFEKSLEIGEYDTEVLLLKANAHFIQGQTKDAIRCCNKISEIDPKNKAVKELLEKIESKS